MKLTNNQNCDSIGGRILKLRLEKGWKPAQLAEKINVTDKAIWKWENGRGEPSLECLILLAKVFGVTLDYLIVGTEGEGADYGEEEVGRDEYVICGKKLQRGQRIYCRSHADLLNTILDTSMKAYYRCLYKLNGNYCIWLINLSPLARRFGWLNVEEGNKIIEKYVGLPENKIASHDDYVGNQIRYIFDFKSDGRGRYYEFKGLFSCNKDCTADLRVWEPVRDE